jgi:hypothetical protein
MGDRRPRIQVSVSSRVGFSPTKNRCLQAGTRFDSGYFAASLEAASSGARGCRSASGIGSQIFEFQLISSNFEEIREISA